MRWKSLIWIVLLWVASVCSPALYGRSKEAESINSNQIVRILADMDGDHIPDVAVAKIEHSVIRIKIRLSSGHTRIILSAPISQEPGLRLTAFDVDDDSNIDLVVTSAVSATPIAVWLNTSRGEFERIKGWNAPTLDHEGSPRLHWRISRLLDKSLIGSGSPVPPVIAENELRYSLDEDRRIPGKELSFSHIQTAFNTFGRGPPFGSVLRSDY